VRPSGPQKPTPSPRPYSAEAQARASAERDDFFEQPATNVIGEQIRRLALGLVAALVTARAYWPSEPNFQTGAGTGLSWVLTVLLVFGLALAGSLIGGRWQFRWSWTDAAVIALAALVAASAGHAADRRPAINLAWEWVGLAAVYLLLRNLPRGRRESQALVNVLLATAIAVAVYGLYQNRFELPLIQREFQRNPVLMLRQLNIEPGTRAAKMFENRLVGSTEVWSTFALPNSLAGYIVGPLVVVVGIGLQNLVRRNTPGSRRSIVAIAVTIGLILLVCLLLTKSRSSWIGAIVGIGLLTWNLRRELPPRVLALAGLASAGVLALLIVAGLAIGRLDRQVLTESTKSLSYRLEYWRGAWGVITDGAPDIGQALQTPVFRAGVGPGNFGPRYVRYKLPQASEEVADPHNMFLEVWATAGAWALLAFLAAVASGLWNLFAKPSAGTRAEEVARARRRDEPGRAGTAGDENGTPAHRQMPGLMLWAGLGGWVTVVALGRLNPFEGDLFFRWIILGAVWFVAALFLKAAGWRRLGVDATVVGAGFVAELVNLLAAGGIGIPTVALGLWSLLALGLNLREDRGCGRPREWESRMPAFGLALGWAAVLGTFFALVTPFWRSEAAIAAAEEALARRPPDVELADGYLNAAIEADRYFAHPWHELAFLHFRVWQERGAKLDDEGSRWDWTTIPYLYHMATTPPRSPDAWALHSERAGVIGRLISLIGSQLKPIQAIKYKGAIVEATRRASQLYPTNAELHARLAEASAAISMYRDAVTEAEEAIRLDTIMPHADRKLDQELRARLEALIPKWRESAATMPINPTP
jgi:O-antigen ligase